MYFRTSVRTLYEGTFVRVTFYSMCTVFPNRKKTYFRARPRALVASIDLKLRHDGVHHAADALK
jgi:hypothetical protein